MGRRYSEPGNIPKAIPHAVDTDTTDACFSLDPIVQLRQHLQGPLFRPTEHAPDSMLQMKASKPINPTTLHPFDVSTPNAGSVDSPSPMSMSAFDSPSCITTSFAAPMMPFFAPLSGAVTSPASLSPSSSPSSSPLADRERSNVFSPVRTESPLTDHGSSVFNLSNQGWGPSSSSNLVMAPGPPMEAPLLVRTQSQGSLMLQPNLRDSSTVSTDILHQGSASRRHSQCTDPTPTSSAATGLLSRPLQSNWQQQQQQQQQQSVYPLSPYNPLGIETLELQHQLDPYPPPSNSIQSTSSMVPHPGLHQLNIQGSFAVLLMNGGTDQGINFEQSLPTTDHFSALQQKLPQTHSDSLPAQHEQAAEQALHILHSQTLPHHEQLDQRQEQQQKSLHTEPLPLDRELTLADFKDARVYEEYKHQKFVLEHKRLQQHQEQEMQYKCQE
ncbi:hypothetical protein BGZ51_009040 [Haplosporangium sp. Z 767]|nr:hypothetical protein BGZ51_009040 [Haplosporangium sp. Z 767]